MLTKSVFPIFILEAAPRRATYPRVKISPSARVSPSSATSPPLPSASDEQRHLVAAQQSTLLRSGAQAYLSEVAAAYPLIQETVRASAFQGLVVPPRADLADFPTSELTEAATALDLQRAGLRLL